MPQHNKQTSLGEAYRALGPYLTLGIQFVVIILLCVFAGKWADTRFGTAPLWTLVGSFFGIAAGFYHFLKAVMRGSNKPGDRG